MKKNVFVFSARVLSEHLERLRARFNVSLLDPAGDIDAQFAAAIPEAHGLIGERELALMKPGWTYTSGSRCASRHGSACRTW